MKTIRTFVFLLIPVVCAACATQQARTVSALPEPPTVQDLRQLQRLPDGNYPGYQRIVVNGQEQFCRQTARGLVSQSRVLCLTEPQLETEHHLLAREQEVQLQLQLLELQQGLLPQSGSPLYLSGQAMVSNLPNSR